MLLYVERFDEKIAIKGSQLSAFMLLPSGTTVNSHFAILKTWNCFQLDYNTYCLSL